MALSSRGTSEPMLTSLDHLVLRVEDLDSATDTYVRLLGRQPSWRGEHPAWGTSNTLFRLDNTYVELLATPDRTAERAAFFARRDGEPLEGPLALAFGTADAEELRRRAESAGLEPSSVLEGSGTDRASGARRAWRMVFLDPARTHGARLFAVEHRSPPDALPRAETASGVAREAAVGGVDHVVVRTVDGDRARALYGDALGIRLALDRRFPEWQARLLFFRLGRLTVELAAPLDDRSGEHGAAGGADRFWGVSYRVPDADAAHDRLRSAGIDASAVRDGRKPGTRVFTVRGETHGVPTLFLEPPA